MTRLIRVATHLDNGDVFDVYMNAFPECENELVGRLASNLLKEKTNPETINLVAELDDKLVGHIAFSPVFFSKNNDYLGYLLAPLAVKPEYQKSGIGSKLIESGIERLSNDEVNVIFVYGDPKFYGRFGFKAEAAENFLPPYELKYPFGWQAKILNNEDPEEEPVTISCVSSLCDPSLW